MSFDHPVSGTELARFDARHKILLDPGLKTLAPSVLIIEYLRWAGLDAPALAKDSGIPYSKVCQVLKRLRDAAYTRPGFNSTHDDALEAEIDATLMLFAAEGIVTANVSVTLPSDPTPAAARLAGLAPKGIIKRHRLAQVMRRAPDKGKALQSQLLQWRRQKHLVPITKAGATIAWAFTEKGGLTRVFTKIGEETPTKFQITIQTPPRPEMMNLLMEMLPVKTIAEVYGVPLKTALKWDPHTLRCEQSPQTA